MDIKRFDLVDSFRLWWAFTWRSTLWVWAISFVVMFFVGFFTINNGEDAFKSSLLFSSIPFLFLVFFIQIWQLKRVIPKQLERFSFNDKNDESTIL